MFKRTFCKHSLPNQGAFLALNMPYNTEEIGPYPLAIGVKFLRIHKEYLGRIGGITDMIVADGNLHTLRI
jgi:hypothetical protein